MTAARERIIMGLNGGDTYWVNGDGHSGPLGCNYLLTNVSKPRRTLKKKTTLKLVHVENSPLNLVYVEKNTLNFVYVEKNTLNFVYVEKTH